MSSRQSLSAVSVEDRGVYVAPYTKNGLPVMYAVNSVGDIVRSLTVLPEWDSSRVAAYLAWKLEQLDPVPRLELVRGGSPSCDPELLNPRIVLDAVTEHRMRRNPRYRARVNQYLTALAATPQARHIKRHP